MQIAHALLTAVPAIVMPAVMCPLRILAAMIMAGSCIGCASDWKFAPEFARRDPLSLPTGPDIVRLDVAVIECSKDEILDELWACADDQAVPLERKAALEDNGLRIAQVRNVPKKLLDLLTSEKTCLNPRQFQLRTGYPKQIDLGKPLSICEFQFKQDGRVVPIRFEQGQCALRLIPTLKDGDRVHILFTPRIQHGKAELVHRPSAARSKWEMEEQQPIESYDHLSWEIPLAPNEFVIVGGRFDKPNTLGFRFFVCDDISNWTQRLLVIRANRSVASRPKETPPTLRGDVESISAVPPLAFQAATTRVPADAP